MSACLNKDSGNQEHETFCFNSKLPPDSFINTSEDHYSRWLT